MFRFWRRRTTADGIPARPRGGAVRSLLVSLAPLGLWLAEYAPGALVLALLAALAESATRLRATGLWGGGARGSGAWAAGPAATAPVRDCPHLLASAVRRALWRAVVRSLGGRRVVGRVPEGPCVVVANHRSHADTAVLLATLPTRGRPRVAAAADHWFARRRRRFFCRWLVGGFPVRRTGGGREDLLRAREFLARGGMVIVFPEGGRGTGAELARFRSGAFELARLAGVPVVPVALTGTARVLAKHGRRCHRAPVRVEFGAPQWSARPEAVRARIGEMLRHGGPPVGD
ncbi:lysophospholipid acyltransferase family protein [Streptomyces leeuwenhoekii]|uniref:1-Acyl-Sn-Glycerol-3-Phosphate Acyltransferase n=1 Tax=Streptomyces leeuwenhoekii TaxID=1437453 RepID=A0A0F7VM18_STRLW|nr:lysophospholipid acyltransferase family protein [Streptomyces leeuwenhoekii]CQR60160.1 1-Acyl-Sn-Glycerol-3-Phosphate Acyltransferase [Streptomyces leeuwenhoekii]